MWDQEIFKSSHFKWLDMFVFVHLRFLSFILMFFSTDGICRSSVMFSWWNSDVWLSRLKDSSRIAVFPRDHRKFACLFSSRFYGNFFLKNSENVLSFQFCSFRALQIKKKKNRFKSFFFQRSVHTCERLLCGSKNAVRKRFQSDSSF